MAIIMFQRVALVFQCIETLILDPPATSTGFHQIDEILDGDDGSEIVVTRRAPFRICPQSDQSIPRR